MGGSCVKQSSALFLSKFCWLIALHTQIYGKWGELLLLERKKGEFTPSFPSLGSSLPCLISPRDRVPALVGVQLAPRMQSFASRDATCMQRERRQRPHLHIGNISLLLGLGFASPGLGFASPRLDLHPCSSSAAPHPVCIARSQRNRSLRLVSPQRSRSRRRD